MGLVFYQRMEGNNMCVYIGIEDLVANALIELVERENKRIVRFKELEKYGAMVVKCLSDQNEEAILVLSKERTNVFLHDYHDYFELVFNEEGIDEGIRLKEDVTIEQLWDTFRGYLTADVMLAFMNDDAIQALGVKVA